MLRNIITIFLLSIVYFGAQAETIGGINSDDLYSKIEGSNKTEGEIELLIYRSHTYKNITTISAPSFDVVFNKLKIATISQSLLAISRNSGEFNFLRIKLPNGKYRVEIHQNTLFNSGLIQEFDAIVRGGMKIAIELKIDSKIGSKTTENLTASKNIINYILSSHGKMTTKALSEINDSEYKKLVESMKLHSETFFMSDINSRQQREAEQVAFQKNEADLKVLAELARKQREDEGRKTQAQKNSEEVELNRREAEQREASLKKQKDATDHEDDLTCKSFGAKFGSDSYVNCRFTLANSRKEQAERERQNIAVQERMNSLQKQLEKNEFQRSADAQRLDEKRRNEDSLRQHKSDEDQRRRERTDRLDAAQRAFEAAARLSQPTQSNIPSFPQPSMPRRTQCFVNGAYVDCRSQ